jgi:hypothetical protein
MRDWLANVSRRKLPSSAIVRALHDQFQAELPALAAALVFEAEAILYADYERILTSWLVEAPAAP